MFRVELFQIINQSHDSSQDLPDSKTPCYVTSLLIKPNISPMVPSSWLCILPVHLVWHPRVLKYSMATVLPGNHTWMDGIISQTPFSFFSHHPALLRVSGSGGVQLLSCIQLFATPWTAACQAPLSFTISQSLLRFMSIESVMLPNCLIFCHPLLLLPQSIPASGYFPMSQLFASGGQSIGASASVLPVNIQGWFPLGLTGLISL